MERSGMKYSLLKNDFLESVSVEKDYGGFSSGYDSSGSHDTLDSDVDFHNNDDDVTNDEDDDFFDGYSFYQTQKATSGEVMRYQSSNELCEQLQYILSLPELCDVTFYVGPEKQAIHGVKAILGTRSRVMYQLLLKKERETEEHRKLSKKFRKSQRNSKTIIDVNKYQPDDFREIIKFMHCGMVDINGKNVVGILCGASQFKLDDLKVACWSFIRKSVTSQSTCVQTILKCAKIYSEHKSTERLVRKINEHGVKSA